MPSSTVPLLLRLFGSLLAAAGFLAWIALGWKAFTDLEGVTAHSDEGSHLMVWALAGTLLMTLGIIVLHFAHALSERDKSG